MSNNPMMQFRDIALQKITQGINIFNTKKDNINERDQGYRLMVSGLEDLIKYRKQETNVDIQNILKPKIDEYLKQAAAMKAEISAQQQNINQQIQKQSQFSYQANNQNLNNINTNMNNNNNQNQYKPPVNNNNNNNNSNNTNNNNGGNNQNNNQGKSQIKEGDKDNAKFEQALGEAIVTEKPNVHWSDVAGLENAKKALNEAVILPIRFPHIFQGMIKPWRGILLYGPPGTGKTFLAKACATECDATFFSISSSDLISKWVGESEKLIKTLFKMAREKKPSIIFIDEIDSMTGNRSEGENEASRRVKTEFLVQMQGVGNDDTGVLVLGATNVPWGLDPAIRRRFEKRIMIPLPEKEARFQLIDNLLNKTPNCITQEERLYIAERTEGFSGSDISILVREASYEPLRIAQRATKFKKIQDKDGQPKYVACAPSDPQGESKVLMDIQGSMLKLQDVSIDHFELALQSCKPSVSEKDIERQIEFTKEFGQDG
ncbi:AAA-type ATPase (macronuclear) [Tetrahymena thermophila SB210]|uniref:AAA-type ATPase n=1 Tax=Tetrahymena thermophila (strain SB210) TaxID=312017 RepID=Q240K0_TETTS|nr:AAA-type ATPase [Tetrahymena thermophila SB210]EAS02208.1 AAA-type ATPase [Tetrahymena thermophila SB210]|eukprot:XP_001022453.1 AAA-type ATPase [Tetrahymena thermophila SB210]